MGLFSLKTIFLVKFLDLESGSKIKGGGMG